MKYLSVILCLSIAALPNIVNGQPLKDSVKEPERSLQSLLQVISKTGTVGRFRQNIARVVGLPGEMPTRDVEVTLPSKNGIAERRGCSVIYEGDRPICAYIVRNIRSGSDSKSQYYRVALDGKLESAILVQGSRDEKGKVIRGSAAKVEQDINSPEVKEAFEVETNYWLKDWLKKAHKSAPKAAAKNSSASR